MSHCIARYFVEPLLRLFLPASGRRRSPRDPQPQAASPSAPVAPPGDGSRVRPCALVPAPRRAEARCQRARRRALWLAVHGVDVGPRMIHGVDVIA